MHSPTRWIFLMSYFLHTMTLHTNFQWFSTEHNINQNSLSTWHLKSTPSIHTLPTSFSTWKHYFSHIDLLPIPHISLAFPCFHFHPWDGIHFLYYTSKSYSFFKSKNWAISAMLLFLTFWLGILPLFSHFSLWCHNKFTLFHIIFPYWRCNCDI